jgi:uncharacterized membrane protein
MVNVYIILSFYIVLTVLLGLIGFMVGKKNDNSFLYSGIGVVIGLVLSYILWLFVGKKLAYQ